MTDGLGSQSLFLTSLEAGLMIVCNILSLLGNILVCISVYRNSKLRTTTNLYIIALAVSDLLSAILVMPLTTGVLISRKWPFGESLCQMHAFSTLFVVFVSPLTMGLTAVNRYVRICKSDQQYQRLFSQRNSLIVLGFVWALVMFFILIPRVSGLQEFRFVPGYAACFNEHLSEIGKTIHYVFVIVILVILPMAVTIFSYRRVFKKIQAHNTGAVQGLQTKAGNTAISTYEIRISKSLFVIVFAFMLCWLPTWIITILKRLRIVVEMPQNVELVCSFCRGGSRGRVQGVRTPPEMTKKAKAFFFVSAIKICSRPVTSQLRHFLVVHPLLKKILDPPLFCVSLSNSINPFIYAGMNPMFRKEFKRTLRCESGHLAQHVSHPLDERPEILSVIRAQAKTSQRDISLKDCQGHQGRKDKSQENEEIELK